MKKAMKCYRKLAIAWFVIFTLGFTTAILANDNVKTNSTAELTFLGSVQNMPVFQLNLNNSEAAEYIITIKDVFNNVLYTEKLKGKKITRKYKLDADEVEMAGTMFEVKNNKTNETTLYKINNNVKVVQDIIVEKNLSFAVPEPAEQSHPLFFCDAYSVAEPGLYKKQLKKDH